MTTVLPTVSTDQSVHPGQSLQPGRSPYQSYVYAYPHKTAYRPLRPRPLLSDL